MLLNQLSIYHSGKSQEYSSSSKGLSGLAGRTLSASIASHPEPWVDKNCTSSESKLCGVRDRQSKRCNFLTHYFLQRRKSNDTAYQSKKRKTLDRPQPAAGVSSTERSEERLPEAAPFCVSLRVVGLRDLLRDVSVRSRLCREPLRSQVDRLGAAGVVDAGTARQRAIAGDLRRPAQPWDTILYVAIPLYLAHGLL
jgi:hypothetical protein